MPFDRDSLPTFVDSFGITRTFTKTTFSVPRGGDHLAASIAWPGNGQFTVRLILLEPDGTYSGFSIPQGAGSGFAVVDIPQPKSGTWTAVLFSSPGAVGFTGTVQFGATTFQNVANGSASPRQQVIPAGATRTVTVRVPAPRKASDTSDALVLTGSGASTVIPITLRTLVPLDRNGGSFTGAFAGGNGRGGIPNPGAWYDFDIKHGTKALSVGFTVNGNTNQRCTGSSSTRTASRCRRRRTRGPTAPSSAACSSARSTRSRVGGGSRSRCSGRCPAPRWRHRSPGRSRSTRRT